MDCRLTLQIIHDLLQKPTVGIRCREQAMPHAVKGTPEWSGVGLLRLLGYFYDDPGARLI